MRLLYYKLYVCKNGQKTDYPLEKLVDTIFNYDASKKLKKISTGYYSMTKMRNPDQEKEIRNRSFWVSKYRDKKPMIGTKGTDEATPIEKDVLETANCLLIPSKNFLAMEYAHVGCRITGLIEYLNSFLINEKTKEDSTGSSDKWTVDYVKVTEKSKISDIKQSENIKRIEVDFLAKGEAKDFLKPQKSKAKSIMEKVFVSSLETASYVSGNSSTFTIKKGHYSGKMDSLDVVKLLNAISVDSDNITSVKVVFDNKVTNVKNDYVDLKHDGQMQGLLLEDDDSTGFEYLSREVSDFYYGEGNRKGLNFEDRTKRNGVDSNTLIYRMN